MSQIWRFIKELRDKELFIYSAALSFYTMLSLIPILFVCFSIFTQIPSFKVYYTKIKGLIFNFLIPAQQDLISTYLDTFLKNSVNLGIVGLVATAFTTLAFFSSYDFVVNRITKNEPKTLWQSISTHWTLITLTPLGLGLSFYISNYIQKTLDDFEVGFNFFEILPFVIIWALFFVSFSSSSAKSKLKILALTSFGSSMIWYISKNIFVYYVVYNKTYTNIYGSFSTLLFFFVWIYISWVIYLYGLKFCHLLSNTQDDEVKPRKLTTKKSRKIH
ncbi:hypothetical protein DMB92_08155 [Campylobacter sp. MIT 99-7217]|uniref:YihY/virulence factor BrkB family protein n=1 Tax=Campylobacter sp. MIT 99-7217 TaxID=535091 RepID=UPI00115B10F2|nr:YihY/virulence factor BrkB family protein [Campylobacter sp. MIT 99-7217]TQR29567.1 hypothetical protein DMB92_08155 [Campylobacter sp. MIT 99-7217]